jgi:hypothetical protein
MLRVQMMSKLSKAKDDLMFLKRRLKEKEEDCNSLWYDLEEDYIKREIKGLRRLIHYTEHFIYTEQMKKNLKDLGNSK